MPNLIEHQLRVAAVAAYMCDYVHIDIDRYEVVTACLLHDMGNMVKFDLDRTPPGVQIDNIDHWKQVQQDHKERFGENAHQASMKIAREIGVSDDVVHYIEHVDVDAVQANLATHSFEQKICAYADTRIGPLGVMTLQGRIDDFIDRYRHRSTPEREEYLRAQLVLLDQLEEQIFTVLDLEPEDITDESIATYQASLLDFEMKK